MTFVDIHSHQRTQEEGVKRIRCLDVEEIRQGQFDGNCDGFTAGFHPWWIADGVQLSPDLIAELLQHPKCFGLGEIGLDRAIKTPMPTQKAVFENHLQLAAKADVRCVVLHCVRAYSDVLEVLKLSNYLGRVIFHDYNGNAQITEQLLNHNAYFSVGSKVFDDETTVVKNLKAIPCEKLFLETDDQTRHSIVEIYEKMAERLGLSSDELQERVYETYTSFF